MKYCRSIMLGILLTVPMLAQHSLHVSPSSVQWGYFAADAKPVLTVKSGDTVAIDTICGIPDMLERLGAAEDVPRKAVPNLNRTVSPHTLRHSKGMHLLESGISLEMIRDFLGHVDVKTTHIYARANLEMKRKALQNAAERSPVRGMPSWQQNRNLLQWLRSL